MSQPVSQTLLQSIGSAGTVVTNGRASIVKVIGVNTSAAAAFLQFFDSTIAAVTLGTTVPRHIIQIPANSQTEFTWDSPGDTFYTQAVVFSTTTATGSAGSAATVYAQVWVT